MSSGTSSQRSELQLLSTAMAHYFDLEALKMLAFDI